MHCKHRLLQTNWEDTNTAKPCTENTILRTWQKVAWMLGMKTITAPQPWLTVLVTFRPIFRMCDDDPNQKPFCNITYIFSWDTADQVCCTMALTEFQNSEKWSPIYRRQLVKPVQSEQCNRMVCMYTSASQPMAINLVPMSVLPIPNDHTMWKTECTALTQVQLPSSQQRAVSSLCLAVSLNPTRVNI
jgi:hypothetical protein